MAQTHLSNIKKTFFALRASFKAGTRVFKATRWPAKTNASFEPLIPTLLEGDRFERYERELLGALNNHEVLNIALTGGYGAGKSSVVKTFLERNPQFPSVTVSLATFSKNAPEGASAPANTENADKSKIVNGAQRAESEGSSSPELINRIEETIVQQLLYAVRADQLPKTRFKRIIQASNSVIYLRATLLVAWLISILRIWMPTLEKQTSLDISWVLKCLMLVPELLAVSVAAAGGIYFVYTVLRFVSMFSIDGLTLKGGKLEATHHGSVLHKNVDEIIYCFERSNTRIVVIEDLDRYDIQDIFFRLREINFTIRHSPQIKRPVHFIYAIRDELFTVTDKTKFFDLIIPVIPVVNSENSHEKMTELMQARSHNGTSLGVRLDPAVVETVCYYIDEMRLIKSIVNEYDIYLGLLAKDGLELDPNKLFAVIVLRNLHPHAYANLIKRQGPIHKVLSGFSEWVRHEVNALQSRIDGLREQLLERENEVLSTTAHLRAGVWYEILQQGGMQNANVVTPYQDTPLTLQQFVADASFNTVSTATKVRPSLNGLHGSSHGNYVEVRKILTAMNYQTREALLQLPVDAVEIEITDLQKEISRLKTISFREAARKQYGAIMAVELVGLEIVTYLMRRGIFDTDYVDYLGYFYEGALTQADKNFILAVGRGEMLDVDTPLQNPVRVVTKLDYECLEDGKGIIAGLIGALVPPGHSDSGEIDDQKFTIILKSGHQYLDRMAEAVHLLLEDSVGPRLIQMIFKKDQNLMYQLLQADRFKLDDARLIYVCTILDNLTVEQLDAMADRKGALLKAVCSLTDISKLIPSMKLNQDGWEWLRRKPAQFDSVSELTTSSEIRQLIAWGCMKLSLPMLQMTCRKLSPETREVSLVSYAGLRSLSLAGLQQSIESNPEAFIEELLGQEGTLPETADSLERLLQLVEDDLELSEKLLDRTDCPVSDLRKAPRQVWVRLLADNRVMPLAAAVWTVFDDVIDVPSTDAAKDEIKENFEDALVEFLDRNAELLSGELWEVNPERDRALQSYLLCKGVSRDILNKLLAKIFLDPNVVLSSSLPPERWGLIAHARFVPYALEIRKAFRALAPRLEGDYLRRCWKDAREDLDLTSLPIDVVWQLTRLDTVSIQDALTMWAGIPYEAFDTCEGSAVELARVCQRANAAGASFPEDYLAVILQVINDGDLSREGRIHMLIQALTINCDRAQILVAVTLLGGEYLHLNQKPQVKLPKSDGDQCLLEALHRRSFIGKIRVEDKHIVAYRRR